MKNLQIGDNDIIGNRFNGHDLHIYLKEKGVESKHLVWNKRTDDSNTFEIANDVKEKAFSNNFQALERHYSTHAMMYPYAFNLLYNKHFLDADIVHYHLVHNNFFSISHFPIVTALKPSVWTLHDPWAMTGHCIYPFKCEKWKNGCGNCEFLDTHFALSKDSTALNWEIKKMYYGITQIDLIVASQWMLNLVKQSPLLSHLDVHLIPFGLDLNIFKPTDSVKAKESLGIDKDAIVLCFRAVESQFKGIEHIRKVLRKLNVSNKIALLTTNDVGAMNEFQGKYQIVDLGWVTDEKVLVNAYNAADIFLMPSTQEAFGMMAIEAMTCGKPVIVFEGTALPDTICAPEGGVVVPENSTNDLYNSVLSLIENEEKRLEIGRNALAQARLNYDSEKYVSKMIDVYNEVIRKRSTEQRKSFIVEQMKRIATDIPFSQVLPEVTFISADVKSQDQNDYLTADEKKIIKWFRKIISRPLFRYFFYKISVPSIKKIKKIGKIK